LWHTNTTQIAPITNNPLAMISTDAGQANLAVIAADHPQVRLDVVIAHETAEWQGWQCHQRGRQKSEIPAPTAVYRLETCGAQRIVTLIYPLAAGMICPVTHLTASAAIAKTANTLHLRDGTAVHLDVRDYDDYEGNSQRSLYSHFSYFSLRSPRLSGKKETFL
jgi:hypothetical protein